jgi:hypothetical protein
MIGADAWGVILTLVVAVPAVAALLADHHHTEGRDTMDYDIDTARADDDGMALARD